MLNVKFLLVYLNSSYLYTWEPLEGNISPEHYGCRDVLSSQQALDCVWPPPCLTSHCLRFLLRRSSLSLLDSFVGGYFCFCPGSTLWCGMASSQHWGEPEHKAQCLQGALQQWKILCTQNPLLHLVPAFVWVPPVLYTAIQQRHGINDLFSVKKEGWQYLFISVNVSEEISLFW